MGRDAKWRGTALRWLRLLEHVERLRFGLCVIAGSFVYALISIEVLVIRESAPTHPVRSDVLISVFLTDLFLGAVVLTLIGLAMHAILGWRRRGEVAIEATNEDRLVDS
ncbi:hypothetical protein [Pandoraea bronchicola]|uniref:Uncharacterized protein n=1 Tax=Pandoraea bronchicola TaxID=2508287 RepID=A0A5E5BYA8_9BURK|nr:hypothetical protein [Pandoraea bronchicola]VVE90534.1 hypothetical protein PBR20603_04519 [Pandoraea bronchicola]